MSGRSWGPGETFDEAANAFDVQFSVPQTHRLRFTQDCFGGDFEVLRDVFESSSSGSTRIQIWIDAGLTDWEPGITQKISDRFHAVGHFELTSPVHILPGGEDLKNAAERVEHILSIFDRDHLDRRSYVVAIGGGEFLDAVGFAAAIAHRGIRLVRLPTTTLAQADSGVGVKNAVNYFGKKNWKGTFATPWAVVNDSGLLAGLSDRDFHAGFSESVKVALLKSPELFDFMVEHAEAIARREMPAAEQALKHSVLLHLEHITRGGDPFEMLQARPLDFGHWSAHKLEALTDYDVRHGEAVSIGVALDTAYSHLTLGLSLELAEKTFATLQSLRLPIWDERLAKSAGGEESQALPAVFDGLEEFRQHLGGELTITLVEDLGKPVNVHQIESDIMLESMKMIEDYAARQTA